MNKVTGLGFIFDVIYYPVSCVLFSGSFIYAYISKDSVILIVL